MIFKGSILGGMVILGGGGGGFLLTHYNTVRLFSLLLIFYGFHSLGGQICIDVVDDIQRAANEIISPDRTVIVPRLNFACNGRITNIRVSVNGSTHNTGTNFPYVQVWRQSPPSQPYTLVERVQIQPSHLINQSANLEANISLTGNNRIQFLSGDVIGFYNPPDSGYTIEDVRTDGYVYYVFRGSNASSLNLATGFMSNRRQPLIQFTLGEYDVTVKLFY